MLLRHIVFVFVLITMHIPYMAWANDFLVENVKVDVTGDNAIEARETGLNNARRDAFHVLQNRLEHTDMVGTIDDRTIATMVDSFTINREKLSKDRYLASVNVRFNENAVNVYFAQQNSGMHMPIDRPSPWRQEPSLMTDRHALQNMVMEVRLQSLASWAAIARQLRTLSNIKTILPQQMNVERFIVQVGYVGDVHDLQRGLQSVGFSLYTNNGPNQYQVPYILWGKG